jgi:hypothetical protein
MLSPDGYADVDAADADANTDADSLMPLPKQMPLC